MAWAANGCVKVILLAGLLGDIQLIALVELTALARTYVVELRTVSGFQGA